MAHIGELSGLLLALNNERVDNFKKELGSIMHKKGWARDARVTSALYDLSFWDARSVPTRYEGHMTRRISISGWHGVGKPGTSRNFGDVKTFFALYDSASPDHRPVVSSDRGILGGDDLTLEELCKMQDEAMAAALEYARKL